MEVTRRTERNKHGDRMRKTERNKQGDRMRKTRSQKDSQSDRDRGETEGPRHRD